MTVYQRSGAAWWISHATLAGIGKMLLAPTSEGRTHYQNLLVRLSYSVANPGGNAHSLHLYIAYIQVIYQTLMVTFKYSPNGALCW